MARFAIGHVLEWVEWQDSQTTFTGWTLTEDIDPDLPRAGSIVSVGFLIRENDEAILIAPHFGGINAQQVCGAMTIPKLAITKRRVLREASKQPA